LQNGLEIIRSNYAASVAKGRISQSKMNSCMALIKGITDFDALGDPDIVIEAIYEKMDAKKGVFAKLDAVCPPGTILATNTSTLDVNEIAAVTRRPGKVIGTHFFSPANVMRLQENVRGHKTSDETIATTMALAKKLGKVGVLVGVCDGFVGNRMLYAYSRQSNFLLEEGGLPEQVDKALYDFGFPMGPFAVGDLAGLDVGWQIRKARASTRPSNLRYSPIADRICEMGRYGQKTSAGWFRYEPGSRVPIADPEIEKLIIQVSEELGYERRAINEAEIIQRCMYPLINEGAKILAEGLAQRPGDIDTVWLYGYGFPRQRGGPMFYADTVGLKEIYDVMSKFYDEHGEWLKPAPLLTELVAAGKSFGDL
jgi:3-hydroxyacyl-CoA dehydrogenase